MPPPELADRTAPASVGQLVLEATRNDPPVSRHGGPRAEEGFLRTLLSDRHSVGDTAGEREACIALARLLASRGLDLDTAANLARRALALGDDPALRGELASWLAGLGEPALAAATLRGLCDPARPLETARTLVKIAVLMARANDPAGAAAALNEAAALDPKDALAVELLGTLAAWAPAEVPPGAAAAAYLAAAARREATKDKEAAFEDLLRAVEIAPDNELATNTLASALAARGRPAAADEALRLHARALANAAPEHAKAVHFRRFMTALDEGDLSRAVGAAIDASVEADLEGEFAAKLDELLAQTRLFDLLAVRLELQAELCTGAKRAEIMQQAARLYSGPLASPDRATGAWFEVLVADPKNAWARTALRDHFATAHDPEPYVEALIRIGQTPFAEPESQPGGPVDSLQELAAFAQEKILEFSLVRWAQSRLVAAGGEAHEAEQLAHRAELEDEALADAQRMLGESDEPAARIEVLRKLAALYRGRPDECSAALDVLAELTAAQPTDRTWAVSLERLASRTGSYELLEQAMRVRLNAELPRPEAARTKLLLATILRRRGDNAGALAEIAPLVGDAAAHRSVPDGRHRDQNAPAPNLASTALILATRTGQPQLRADALVHLAASAWPSLRSVLLATAAELYAEAGANDRAQACAEQAIESDPSCSRAISVRAAIAVSRHDPASAIEAAISALFPTGSLCDGLATTLETAGEINSALAWTQRLLALRPGSPDVVSGFIRRAVHARDAARLADAIGWVLAQPKPLGDLAPSFTYALRTLFDLDRTRAAPIMRRTLDVFGPRSQLLRSLLIELAEALNDSALIITVLERWLASEPSGTQASEILLDLAGRRIAMGDYDGAARETARAAERGADPHRVLERLDDLETRLRQSTSSLGSDGLVALGEAKVRTLHALGPVSQPDAAAAWRELGSLRWDLVGDRKGADDALYHASELSGERGVERYARDLCAFAGVDMALDALIERAASLPKEQSRKRAGLLIEAANLAHANDLPQRALLAASNAIEADPSRADAVALVEKSSHVEGGIDALDHTYDVLAAAALGCYGRRAAHYRGARQLERRGAIDPAFRHAVASFEAVPSEGTSYILLSRLAERASDPAEAVRALERVATIGNPVARTMWLLRAAGLAGKGEDGARLRFDLLLRALNVRPEPTIVETLGEAVADLLVLAGDADVISMRLGRAVTVALPRLDGPDGARAAVALARVAVQTLRACNLGIEAIKRAMAADGDIDEFTTLTAIVPVLVEDNPEASAALLAEIQEELKKPYSSIGTALLRFASSLAAAVGDKLAAASLLVRALQRSPEDEALLHQAGEAVHAADDAALERAFAEALPAAQRAAAFLELADEHEREGHLDRAVSTLTCVLEAGSVAADERDRVVTRLRQLFHLAGKPVEIEPVLLAELGRSELSAPVRLRLARSLAASLAERDESEKALELLVDAAAMGAFDDELVVEARRLARRVANREKQVEALVRLADMVQDDPNRLALLRELAPILHDLGDSVAANQCYEAIARIDPTDVSVLQALERDAHARGDNEAISVLLARRIETVDSPEGRRTLRLRRAAFLEQRLNRLDEACGELQALLVECPDDVVALRYLADIHERLDEPLQAAPLWRRLADIAARTDEEGEYGVRALVDYLAGGSLDHARAMLERIAPVVPRDTVLELRVEIARLEGDPRALSDALDLLATSSRDAPERRALLLVEAARASSSAGDDTAALERARRALRIAPASADAILEVLRLEYRARGTGTPREAQALVETLSQIEGPLSPEQMELHTFLLAEELDVIQGGGAGMRELTKRHAEFGPLPLIALGMAERLSRSKHFEAALPLFERALGGDLHGLRRRGHVAISAAEAAFNADQDDAAMRLLDAAADEPETRALALRRKLEITAVRGEPTQAREALEELGRLTTGIDRARVLLQLGRLVAASDHAQAIAIFTEAAHLAASERVLSAQIAEELSRIRPTLDPDPTPSSHAAASRRTSSGIAAAPDSAKDLPAPSSRGPASSRDTSRERDAAHGPPSRITPVALDPLEIALFDQLLAGSFAAGEQLIERYGPNLAGRSADVLKIRKHQAALRPGDRHALERLYEAAILDRNPVYARAVEHVICGFNPSAVFIAPPPLASQPEAPELLKTLLFRTASSPVNQALSVIWETGRYRRELSHYGLTGVERVHPGAGTVIAEVYATAARLVGLLRVALFQRRVGNPGVLQTQVALLSNPAIILTGDVREDTPELRYVIGAALAGVMPEHALASGLSEDAFRTLIQALVAAFGPVNQAPPAQAAVVQLSQALWQLVPPRAERRFREVFASSESTEYERTALESSRQAMRRAGLFASGSIVTAVRMTVAELNVALSVPLTSPDGLARACAAQPAVADLVRLATRAEYAEARWQPASSPDRRPESIRWRAGT